MDRFDVIVIGGGHAGAEAASAAARCGARTLLLTQNLETIGQMSCNPAIGGIAKGTVVREVDALGGIMARATDLARVQFRMLNRSKGPAVWSPRAQCDRGLYRRAVRSLLERERNLVFVQGTVAGLVMDGSRVTGVTTREGLRFQARAVVLTAGTFLRGRIHMGLETQIAAGRAGEAPSIELSQVIAAAGVTVERFKTGTPPRIDGRTVDLARLQRQDGDPEPYWFSFLIKNPHPQQLPCYLTWAGADVKTIILDHLKESALYGGAISGRGPRYCPSVEDKIVKFPDAARHQVFLEPEGLETSEMYVNGLSTSLPPEVQLEFLRKIPGLETVRMTRPGYAIEYDYFPPTQLTPALEVRNIPGLFMAGQVNGTTGYEEAAGQGVVAGINAASLALDREPLVLGRAEAYIGVLVDDLVSRGVDEPYRLFTSRAEYRLLLRQDNALRRLLPVVRRYGLLNESELRGAERRLDDEDAVKEFAVQTSLPSETANQWVPKSQTLLDRPIRISELLRRPGIELAPMLAACDLEAESSAIAWAETEIKYEGYIQREWENVRKLEKLETFELPAELPYQSFQSVSFEGREKLQLHHPPTLGLASRIPGISPSDLQGLVLEVLKWREKR